MNNTSFNHQYPYKTELHAHTKPVSPCGDFLPEEVVKTYQEKGCHSLTITNHLIYELLTDPNPAKAAEYYLGDYFKAKKAAEGSDFSVLLGVEIRFTESSNDYLLYGISPEDLEELITLLPVGITEFYKRFKNKKNLIIQAHPYRKNSTPAPANALDGVEVMNTHPGHNSRIALAARYARENNLLVTGGSDYHHLGHDATCLLRTAHHLRDSYDLAEALKSKDYLLDLEGQLILPYYEN